MGKPQLMNGDVGLVEPIPYVGHFHLYYQRKLPEETVLVTRKGQVTIPVEQRRKFHIREGMRMLVKESSRGVELIPVTPIEDLAGIDAGKISLEEMRKRLDESRMQDRY